MGKHKECLLLHRIITPALYNTCETRKQNQINKESHLTGGKMEERGIDPLTSRMLSERSTI